MYSAAFAQFGATIDSTFQSNPATQELRFERLVANLDLTGADVSVLDVGCGFADLFEFLSQRGFKGRYTGIELVESMARVARDRYPELDIRVADILDVDHMGSFDYVVQSGVFNIHGGVSAEEWRSYCSGIVSRMFELSKVGIAFNALTTFSTFSDPALAYFSPSFWEHLLHHDFTRYYAIDHAYPLFEYTVTAFQPAFIKASFPSQNLAKYFTYLESS